MGVLRNFQVFGCAHEFSWPRHIADGQGYQVCLTCGAEYAYDWNSMRRGSRISGRRKTAKRRSQPWQARARRLSVEIPARFRQLGANDDWCQATIRNISRSGVLLEAERVFAMNSELEIVFDFRPELCPVIMVGDRVAAQGRVIRLDSDCQRMGVAVLDWAAASAPGLTAAS
jgi:PilZ domain